MERIDQSPLLFWIKRRIKRNKNCIIVINGPTGSGKTYAALELARQIAEMLGTNFDISSNMDFNFAKLLKKMFLPQNQKPGTPFLFEEVGAVGGGAASREWQSKTNRFFNSFMQTSRHKNQIFIMTCPFFSDLELGSRKLTHIQMETNGIDVGRSVVRLKPKLVQVNSLTGKFYFKYLRFRYQGIKSRFKIMELGKAPEEVLTIYEKLKTSYTNQLNREIIEADKPKEKPRAKVDLFKLKELKDRGISNEEIAKIFGCCAQTIVRANNKIKKIKIEPNKATGIVLDNIQEFKLPA